MSELEQNLRDARQAIPEPDADATDSARAAVLEAAAQWQPTRHSSMPARRILFGSLAFATAVTAAFVAGFIVAPGGATSGARPDGPGFLPARGWSTFQAGVTIPSAMAANVRLHKGDAWTFPWETSLTLRSGDVLIYATFYPAGEAPSVDRHSFTKRGLPFALADIPRTGPMTGQPRNVVRYRLLARVNGYDVDVNVFLNARDSSAGTREVAAAELERLVVPEAPAVPNLAASPPMCTASQLRGSSFLTGGAGQLVGAISVVNVGKSPCTLSGRPEITLEDFEGRAIRSTQTPGEARWAYDSAPQPRGWPQVRLGSRHKAMFGLGFRNWCGSRNEKVFFNVWVPKGGHLRVPETIDLRCDLPHAPVALTVGPFEPPS
jgi:hypothetical protein